MHISRVRPRGVQTEVKRGVHTFSLQADADCVPAAAAGSVGGCGKKTSPTYMCTNQLFRIWFLPARASEQGKCNRRVCIYIFIT